MKDRICLEIRSFYVYFISFASAAICASFSAFMADLMEKNRQPDYMGMVRDMNICYNERIKQYNEREEEKGT